MLHILNGSALLDKFPKAIEGTRLVCHECFVEGPVKADSLKQLGIIRSQFLYETYNAPYEDYISKMVLPFDVLGILDTEVEIHLWFEEDLFCQTNMWYMIHLLMHYKLDNKIFLVRPHTSLQFGFGALDAKGLEEVFPNKEHISYTDLIQFDALWFAYSRGDNNAMKRVGESLCKNYSFVHRAIEAHFQRQENGLDIGLLKATLIEISNQLGTKDFGTVFREFSKRLPIYGFGDLQVKRLWEEILVSGTP